MSQIKVKFTGVKSSLFNDFYYRMIKSSWPRFFLMAALAYIGLNFLFALLYYFSGAQILNARANSLWDAFMFSFQTSTTIGYGHFLPNSQTAHAIVVVDALAGIFYVAIITGLAFSKFARPSANILYTDNIIYSSFDGKPALMFRMANGRDTHIIDASIKASVLMSYKSTEGIELRRNYTMNLLTNYNPTFLLTWTVIHIIDDNSPLREMTFEQIKNDDLIFLSSFNGNDSVLSQGVYTYHRYTSNDLVKAKKFKDILSVNNNNSFKLDYESFHKYES